MNLEILYAEYFYGRMYQDQLLQKHQNFPKTAHGRNNKHAQSKFI